MSTFAASKSQFNQYHFTVIEVDLPIGDGATSLPTAIELAEPQWYWKLNEETGIVATDTMLNGNLEYESAASTASYNILPSTADEVGSAKNIRGDTTFQIYDPIPPPIALDSTEGVNAELAVVNGMNDNMIYDGVNAELAVVNGMNDNMNHDGVNTEVKIISASWV